AAGRGYARHRSQERAAVEEPARGPARRGGLHRDLARAFCGLTLQLTLVRGNEPVADARDPEAVERHRHRVRGEVAGTRARPGTGDAFELVELVAADQAAFLCADGLPDVLDRHLAA